MSGHRIRQFGSEEVTHQQVIDYIKLRYPDVIARTDFAAGVKLQPWQAARHSKLQTGRGFPDITVFEPREVPTALGVMHYCGLALELKASHIKLKRNDGEWMESHGHIQEQAAVLERLAVKGYFATFACGFDEAKNVIDFYLTGAPAMEVVGLIPHFIGSDSSAVIDDSPF